MSNKNSKQSSCTHNAQSKWTTNAWHTLQIFSGHNFLHTKLPRQSVPHSRPPKATWTKIECTFSAHARTISEWRMWPPSLWLLCIWLTRTTKLRYPQHIVDNLAGGVRKSQENLRTAVLYVEHFSQLASKEIKLLAKIPGICRNRLCRASLWVHTQRKVLSLQGHNIVILIFLFVFRLQNSPFHSDILST